jgi:hypothetical protein
MLDGLDEVSTLSDRRRCRDAINAYLYDAPREVPVIITCRTREYLDLLSSRPRADYLAVNGGVRLLSLSRADVLRFIDNDLANRERFREGAADVSRLVRRQDNEPIARLLRTPLFFSLLEYSPDRVEDLIQATSDVEVRAILIEGYLSYAIENSSTGDGQAITRRWLAALAAFLRDPTSDTDQTTFYFESLTPRTVPEIGGAFFASGLAVCLVLGGLVGAFVGPRYFGQPLRGGVLGGVAFSAIFFALPLMFATVTIDPSPATMTIRKPSLKALSRSAVDATIGLALTFILVTGGFWLSAMAASQLGLYFRFSPSDYVAYASVLYLVSVPLYALWHASTITVAVSAGTPDAGMYASVRSVGLTVGISVALWLLTQLATARSRESLSSPLGVVYLCAAIVLGFVISLNRGGWYVILQKIKRRNMRAQDLVPSDIRGFFSAACRCGIMRRVSGGYQFRHRVFLEYLAGEAARPGIGEVWPASGSAGPSSLVV